MALDLARWQFAVTTLYHFLFVPVTIGTAWFLVGMQTAWYRTGDERWLRLTRFFGKLFLINFALGVVTGIVQEFQFGMNWSAYSRYVGDIFGAPLAIEGLAAFFLESTFLGLWIFGWDRLKPKVHLATIWLVAIGTTASAYFILAANSWMQHPVGYKLNPATHRAELTSIAQILTNNTLIRAFGHTIAAAALTAAMLVLGVAAWHLRRGGEAALFRPVVAIALWSTLAAGIATILIGHAQGQLMTKEQPMKMASAEALYTTESGARFSLFDIGPWQKYPSKSLVSIAIPHGLSILADNSWNGTVKGINDIQDQYAATYGPGNYKPIVGVTYWTFRIMTGLGFLAALIAILGLWLARRPGRLESSHRFLRFAVFAISLPFLANLAGWIFTEMGRQPWIVQGLLLTKDAVSPSVGAWSVGLTLAGFTLLYGILAAVEAILMIRAAKHGPDPEGTYAGAGSTRDDAPLRIPAMTY
ncbi:MAG TPA: cytochrome ubiquinol oxidase subunit I [Gaiellaceae bacterium]|nr:cytochrome ubiquinol oxidase subunit I [Gaiellaceae bacterium]